MRKKVKMERVVTIVPTVDDVIQTPYMRNYRDLALELMNDAIIDVEFPHADRKRREKQLADIGFTKTSESATPNATDPPWHPVIAIWEKSKATWINSLMEQENTLYRLWGGHIPEANTELNNLQREKINAVYAEHGKAYIGKINLYGAERESLSANSVFTEYTMQTIYNFGADFVVPIGDRELAEMIVQWNGTSPSAGLVSQIHERVEELGGLNLRWA